MSRSPVPATALLLFAVVLVQFGGFLYLGGLRFRTAGLVVMLGGLVAGVLGVAVSVDERAAGTVGDPGPGTDGTGREERN